MASPKTVERIYKAAEELFAEQGFSETSLRLITKKARVNLASVNYHFGSKEGLVKAVFSRFLAVFCTELEKVVEEYEAKDSQEYTVEELLTVFMQTALAIKTHDQNGLVTFMRLLGSALTQKQMYLHEHLMSEFGGTLFRYIALLHNAVPYEIPSVEWFWRVYFTLGTIVFSLSNIQVLRTFLEEGFSVFMKSKEVVHLMIPFLVAGLSAKSTLADETLLNAQFNPFHENE